jgi:uncharacterized membrane protein
MHIHESLSGKVALHRQRSHRIEALADGVFAIAMTLLVLDIRVPLGEVNTEHELWNSLLKVSPKILTFIISFLAAGQFWIIFINQFNYMHTADRNENVIAIFYLMFISLLPFSTSFLSDHLWSRVAVGFYISNIFLIAITLTIHWRYSYFRDLVKAEDNQEAIIHRSLMKHARIAFTVYSIAAVCCFFSSYLAFAVLIIIQITFTFIGFIDLLKKKKKKTTTKTHTNQATHGA